MRRFVWFGPGLVVLLAMTVTLLAAPMAMRNIQTSLLAADVRVAQARLDASGTLEQINISARAIADSTLPGVVHITARAPGLSTGAGWFYDATGHIVTNSHVVRDANPNSIRVEFYDGRVKRAEVVGVDLATDIAVLKVDVDTTPFVLRRATNGPVHVGDRVYAFGSPFGIKFSMSEGIVSGLGRSEAAGFLGVLGGYTNFIQTDAAMNPGNSGGPLINADGRVVGMNTAIANSVPETNDGRPFQGQSAGIGFAMPLETIESVADQLIESPTVLRGYLGISLAPLMSMRQSRLEDLGYEGPGVVVGRVEPGHPAASAGLVPGDVIISIDDRSTPDPDVLRSFVSIKKPGDTVKVKVWRKGPEDAVGTMTEVPVKLGGAYFSDRLVYIPGSENMTRAEMLERAVGAGQVAE